VATDQLAEARKTLKKAEELAAKPSPEILIRLGLYGYLFLGDAKRAVPLLQKARKGGGSKTLTALALTAAYARLNDMDKATAELKTVRKLWPWMNAAMERVNAVGHFQNRQRATENYIDPLLKAGMPEWPYGFKGRAEHRLRNAELQALYRGRPKKEFGTTPFGSRYELLYDGKGNVTAKTVSGPLVGTYVIERDRLCHRNNMTLMGRKYCGEVYRNPKSSPQTNDRYIRINLWGAFRYSFQPYKKKSLDRLAGEKKLTGAEIKAAFSGAKTSTTNSYGTFILVWKADGTMTGKEKSGRVPPDDGKWWVKGNRYCRKWTKWFGGEEECFGVTLDGDQVKFWRADGSDTSPTSTLTLTK
jgi:hypothetical protein